MSNESVQFVEMVREASKNPNSYDLYCEYCGLISEHALDDRGQWEIYICAKCGNQKRYKVM